MDKEVIRLLCQFMAQKHNIKLDSIRIGSNQRKRAGSATIRRDFLVYEGISLSMSVSTYCCNGENEELNTLTKVSILNTIIHEFAHLEMFAAGVFCGHDFPWMHRYHVMLLEDWGALVNMYNLLACDSLPCDLDTMVRYNQSRYFHLERLERLLI